MVCTANKQTASGNDVERVYTNKEEEDREEEAAAWWGRMRS